MSVPEHTETRTPLRAPRPWSALAWRAAACCAANLPLLLEAQSVRPFQTEAFPLRSRISVVVNGSASLRTASHNEHIDGAFRSVAAHWSVPLFSWRRAQVAWLGEISPAVFVTTGAPSNRIPSPDIDPQEALDPNRLARYQTRDVYGAGFAPLGAEFTYATGSRRRVVLNVTSGVSWFNRVVPYGKATQGNFTVAPGLFIEQRIGSRESVSVGYQLHHLSNASIGGANPGLNSHLFAVRLSRWREP